jgi:hypothetical protein
MPREEETFWTEYRALVSRLMPSLKKSDGAAEEDVVAAEQRLGLRLPRLLREFYLLTDERDDINGVHNRLYPLDALVVEGDVLVFYEEDQGVCLWGVRLRDDDPAFLCRNDGVGAEWDPDFDCLSQFLVPMLYLQPVNGGRRYCGVGMANGIALAAVLPNWTAYSTGGSWKNFVLVAYGQLLYLMDSESSPSASLIDLLCVPRKRAHTLCAPKLDGKPITQHLC